MSHPSAETILKQSVLITGCSAGGIGASLADVFLQKGYIVFATARTIHKIPSSVSDHPNAHVVQIDVTSPKSITAAAKSVKETLAGRGLDILVNNSGLGTCCPGLDVDIDEAKDIFEVNFWGVLRTTQAFADLLVLAQGTIVNVSSIAGEMEDPHQSIYCASKAALTIASETWRLELAALGVKVVTVITGVVESKWFEGVSPVVLPETSYFRPIEKVISDKRQGKLNEKAMDTQEFARRVVGDVVAGKTGRIHRGSLASTVCLAVWWFPRWIMNYMMVSRRSGLLELAKLRKAA